jgi:hypothetical protein
MVDPPEQRADARRNGVLAVVTSPADRDRRRVTQPGWWCDPCSPAAGTVDGAPAPLIVDESGLQGGAFNESISVRRCPLAAWLRAALIARLAALGWRWRVLWRTRARIGAAPGGCRCWSHPAR